MPKNYWIISLTATAAILTLCSGCSGQSASDVSKDLADKLTDSMDFTPGEKKTGTKPVEHATDSVYPQVTGFTFPEELYKGPFKINVSFTYEADTTDISAVVFHVVNSGKYWRIPVTVTAKGVDISISGTFLADNADIFGKQQNVEVAVLKTGDLAGNYMSKPVTPKAGSNPNPTNQELLDSVRLAEGNSYDVLDVKNIPSEFQEGVPRVSTLSTSKDTVKPGEEFALYALFSGPKPKWMLFQVAGAETYMQIALKDDQVSADSVTMKLKFDLTETATRSGLLTESESTGSVTRALDQVLGLKAALMSEAGKRGNFGETQIGLKDNPAQPDGGVDAGSDSGRDSGSSDAGSPDSGFQDGGTDGGAFQWVNTGNMISAHFMGATVLMPGGEVLAAGGYDSPTSVGMAAELYDPVSYVWKEYGSMSYRRAFFPAVLLTNGHVLAAGGADFQATMTGTTEIFSGGGWSTGESMNQPRAYHQGMLLESGKVMFAGGVNDKSCELYDPVNIAWSFTGEMKEVRRHFTLTRLPDGRLLAVGGMDGLNSSNTTEIYDPSTGEWTYAEAIDDVGMMLHTATLLLDGTVLVVGGAVVESGLITSTLERAIIYNPAVNSWHSVAPLPWKSYAHTAVLMPDGKVLVSGGTTDQKSGFKSAAVFDPISVGWTPVTQMNNGRAGAGAVLQPCGKPLVVSGLSTSTDYLSISEYYDPKGSTAPAPDATISGLPESTEVNTYGLIATVPATADARYYWMIENGVITAGLGTNSVTIKAGTNAGDMKVHALVVSKLGIPAQQTANVVLFITK